MEEGHRVVLEEIRDKRPPEIGEDREHGYEHERRVITVRT